MEPIFFYLKETPFKANDKFMLDFSNTELVYQINFSTENDYYITTMNCNLVIANNYGDLLHDIYKTVFIKKPVVITKRTSISIQFIFDWIRLSFPGMDKNVDEM